MYDKVTIFKNALEKKKPYYIPVRTIVDRIKYGSKSLPLIQEIRSTKDKDRKKELKLSLPSICFSGIFKERNEQSIEGHTGLLAIDFDHLNERLKEFKERICKDKYTYLAFISPSGDGLKLIVKIPNNISTHKLSCDAIEDYYKDESLDNFKDLCRICFESYDPEVFYNPDSEVFTTLKEEKKIKKVIETKELISDFDEIIKRIHNWLEKKGEFYVDGNKHKFIVKIASACNRFGIPEIFAIQKLIFNYINKATSVDPKDFEEIIHRVYKNYGQYACTAFFEKNGTAIETLTQTVLTDVIFDITLPLKDVIYLDNVRDIMIQTFHTGKARGESTHFISIDEHYRAKRGEVTLVTGIGNHGKTVFLLNICLLFSIFEGYKWAVFSPEQDPPDDFYDDLIHIFTGKNTQPFYANQIPLDEYTKAMDFIKEHFFYIYPDSDIPNQDYINARFEEVIKKHKADGCIIDPFNQLDNDLKKYGGRDDQYISGFLTVQKRFSLKHNIFMFIVAHPKGNLTKTNGNYDYPDVYDLAGGAMWSNKCDNILCIHRPLFTTDKSSSVVNFYSQKIKKQKLCGRPGCVGLTFDVTSQRYYEFRNDEIITPFGDKKLSDKLKDEFDQTQLHEFDFNNIQEQTDEAF